MLRVALLAAIAGCYAPSATTGAPCDERMVCPSEQVCLDGRCRPEGTVLPTDAPPPLLDAPPPGDASLGAWSTPTPVGIALGSSKSDPSFTPDRLTVVYGRNDDIFIATRQAIGGSWTVADLDVLNTAGSEKCPEITPDGKTIYFAANPDGDYDIFVSTLDATGWSIPQKVPNWDTASNEQDVAISPDELTAIVAVSGDMRRATRASKADAWPLPVDVGVNWGTNATAPTLDSAGDVYYHAGTTRDLWVARRTATGYATPVPVTELNSAGRDAAPFVAGNDRHIMFERDSELVESSR